MQYPQEGLTDPETEPPATGRSDEEKEWREVSVDNDSAAATDVAVVERNDLTGGDARLRLCEHELVTEQRRGERCAMRTRLYEHGIRHGAGAMHIAEPYALAQQVDARANRHGRGRDRYVGHVTTFTDGDAQTAPLPDRERIDAVVRADNQTALVDDRALPARNARTEKRLPPAALDEADVHALALVGRAERERAGALAHFGLRELSDRKQRVCELAGAEHVEDVRLVLGEIGAARQRRAVRGGDD